MIKVAVIGLGYVGLPVMLSFSKNYKTIGYDINNERVKNLNNLLDSNGEFTSKDLNNKKFTNKLIDIKSCNHFIVTVPTPTNKNNKPNLKHLKNSSYEIGKILKKNDIVIYESTVFPGTTENFCIPILEKESKLKLNKDFYCSYSPERINPGDNTKQFENIAKIVSGSNKIALKKVFNLYNKVISAKIHKSESIIIAESSKIIENIQRDVNIAFMNELFKLFSKLNIPFSEVLKMANTKWNFLNFNPGLVGGHCVSVDPYYLIYLANKNKIKVDLISKSRQINNSMVNFIYNNTNKILKYKLKHISNPKLLILGLTFKENVRDSRNSLAIKISNKLSKKYNLQNYDPHLNELKTIKNSSDLPNLINYPKINHYNLIIILVKHDFFLKLGIKKILKFGKKDSLLYDCFNSLKVNHKRLLNFF